MKVHQLSLDVFNVDFFVFICFASVNDFIRLIFGCCRFFSRSCCSCFSCGFLFFFRFFLFSSRFLFFLFFLFLLLVRSWRLFLFFSSSFRWLSKAKLSLLSSLSVSLNMSTNSVLVLCYYGLLLSNFLQLLPLLMLWKPRIRRESILLCSFVFLCTKVLLRRRVYKSVPVAYLKRIGFPFQSLPFLHP